MDTSFSGFAESVALEAGSLETDEGESLSDTVGCSASTPCCSSFKTKLSSSELLAELSR